MQNATVVPLGNGNAITAPNVISPHRTLSTERGVNKLPFGICEKFSPERAERGVRRVRAEKDGFFFAPPRYTQVVYARSTSRYSLIARVGARSSEEKSALMIRNVTGNRRRTAVLLSLFFSFQRRTPPVVSKRTDGKRSTVG